MALRATAHLGDNGYIVGLLEEDPEHAGVFSVRDVVEADTLVEAVHTMADIHDLHTGGVLVRNAEGDWEEPDCLTLTEALECTL